MTGSWSSYGLLEQFDLVTAGVNVVTLLQDFFFWRFSKSQVAFSVDSTINPLALEMDT